MPTKNPSQSSSAAGIDISDLHSLERQLEAKLRRQEAAVEATTSQLNGIRAMLRVAQP